MPRSKRAVPGGAARESGESSGRQSTAAHRGAPSATDAPRRPPTAGTLGRRPRRSTRGRTRVRPNVSLPSIAEGREFFLGSHRFHEAGSRDDLNASFTRKTMLLARRWRAWSNERLGAIGQTQARWEALFWIAVSRGRATQRELAERVGVEGPTLARMLDRLEAEGLVRRRAMQADRRTKTIALQEAAQPVLEQLGARVDQLRAQLLADIEPRDLAVCIAVMDRILDKLERR